MEKSKRGKGGKDDSTPAFLLDKTQVLQQAKECFNAKSVSPARMVTVLTNCVYIFHRGDVLTSEEATNLFIHITQLFQCNHNVLRRLIYISIKALSKQADNVFAVTASLTKDINSTSNDPAVRASALRALCQISDASTLTSMEKYLKQCILDNHPVVASAAISSLVRIAQVNIDIVKKCTNEIQEALKSGSPMVQYHALGLRYNVSRNDRISLSQLIDECIEMDLKSPLAICLLIRIIANYINDYDSEDTTEYRDYIKNQMNQSDMVEFEAANSLISLKSGTADSRKAAVSHLKNFLTSSRSALKYGAVRILADNLDPEERFWSINRVGNVCKLYLLHKHYRPEDHIVGLLDFSESDIRCARCSLVLECEDTQQVEVEHFCLDTRRTDFAIQIPTATAETSQTKLHCVLSLIFHIVDKNQPKELFEDRVGTIELSPSKIETKPFRCDFPIAIYSGC